jgi:hypothetical protein
VKINKEEIREYNAFVYFRNVVKKNGKIKKELTERNGKVLKLYHLTKSLLWNKNIDRRCKITKHNMYLKDTIIWIRYMGM